MPKPFNLRRGKLFELIKSRSAKYAARVKPYTGRIVKVAGVRDVTQLLSIPYVVVGGHALAMHGHSRATDDVDILVNPSDVQQAMTDLGGKPMGVITIGGQAITMPDGLEVDLLAPSEPWVAQAVASGVETQHGRVISKPYLVLMKLWASRGAQEDMDMMVMLKSMTPVELKLTKGLVRQFLPNDVADLKNMLDYAKYV